MAPRVIFQYVNLDMGDNKFEQWTIDSSDGEESWREWNRVPNDEYKEDGTCNINQYHKMIHDLYKWEVETDEFIHKWRPENSDVSIDQCQWR